MNNYEGAGLAPHDLRSDDDGPEEDCRLWLMPFQSDDIEKDFQRHFHKEQALWDIVQCASIVIIFSMPFLSGAYIRATELAPGVASLPNLAAMYASVGAAIAIAALALFCNKVYVEWRLLIIFSYRALLAHNLVVLFYMSSVKREQPLPWKGAILKIMIIMSRVVMPIFHFMSFQVPISGWFLMTQCTMLAYFLRYNEQECRGMAIQPSLQRGVEEFLGFWRKVNNDGGSDLCLAWCSKHMSRLPLCGSACPAVLQMFWRVVGRPSIQMCVSYRVVVEILFGFAMPLSYVYIYQVLARRRYARRLGLPEGGIPLLHARSANLLLLDAVLILGSVVGQLTEHPLHLLG